ncbi:hypothetical protein BD560DRAFT_112937, partial [Blakeslea trispora]
TRKVGLHKNSSSDRVAEKIAHLESQFQSPVPQKTQTPPTNLQRQIERMQTELKDEKEQSSHLKDTIQTLESELSKVKLAMEGQAHDASAQVSEMIQNLEQLRVSHTEKERQIEQQQTQLKQQAAEFESLSKTGLDEGRMTDLENQIKRMQEDNLEYTALSEELEKEIHRMTEEKEGLVEALEESEETIQTYKSKLNDLKSIVGTSNDQELTTKLKQMIEERSAMSTKLAQMAAQDQSSANNNKIVPKSDGSGALSQNMISSADYDQLKKDYEEQMKQMISLESFQEQKAKYEASEKQRKKLEKQLEELLSKKSSFLCF